MGGVELTVRDDGCGLEDADTAFDPFLGEVSQRPGDPENGLRTACRIVADHGGELRIESAAGRGNLVTALLLDRAPACADGTLELRPAADECAEFEKLALPLAGWRRRPRLSGLGGDRLRRVVEGERCVSTLYHRR